MTTKAIQNLVRIGHLRLKPIRVNNVISLALTDAFALPIESVLAPPDEGTYGIFLKAQFLLQFPLQFVFDRFTRFEAAARYHPKPLLCVRVTDSKEKNLILRRKENGTDCGS
jgi:hypothetical protein